MQFWENWLTNFVRSGKSVRWKFGKKILNSFFFKRFLRPTYCSRNEKWTLWSEYRKNFAESPETFWSKSKENIQENFSSEKIFLQHFLLDTYKANWRRLPKRLQPMCENIWHKVHNKNDNILVFFFKTFVVQQNYGLVEWSFC